MPYILFFKGHLSCATIPRMQRNEIQGVVVYQSEKLLAFPGLIHAVTTRHGGVSPLPFNTLNLSAHVGDDPAHVNENLNRLFIALGLERDTAVDASKRQADQVACV